MGMATAKAKFSTPLLFRSKLLCFSLLYLFTSLFLALYSTLSSTKCIFRSSPFDPIQAPLFTYPSSYGEHKYSIPTLRSACTSPVFFSGILPINYQTPIGFSKIFFFFFFFLIYGFLLFLQIIGWFWRKSKNFLRIQRNWSLGFLGIWRGMLVVLVGISVPRRGILIMIIKMMKSRFPADSSKSFQLVILVSYAWIIFSPFFFLFFVGICLVYAIREAHLKSFIGNPEEELRLIMWNFWDLEMTSNEISPQFPIPI